MAETLICNGISHAAGSDVDGAVQTAAGERSRRRSTHLHLGSQASVLRQLRRRPPRMAGKQKTQATNLLQQIVVPPFGAWEFLLGFLFRFCFFGTSNELDYGPVFTDAAVWIGVDMDSSRISCN